MHFFLTILRVKKTLRSFRLALEGKAGKKYLIHKD